MHLAKWGLAALGLFVASGAIALGAMSVVGSASAQTPPPTPVSGLGDLGARYEQLLAQQLGISVDKLQSAEKATRDQIVDQQLQAGKLNADQAAKLKALPPTLGGLGKLADGFRGRAGTKIHIDGGNDVIGATAKVLGIQKSDVETALKNKQSLAALAQSKGMDRATFKSKLLTELQNQIQAAVTNKKLDQSMADKLKASLNDRIDGIIDGTGPRGQFEFHGGPRGNGGPPSGGPMPPSIRPGQPQPKTQ